MSKVLNYVWPVLLCVGGGFGEPSATFGYCRVVSGFAETHDNTSGSCFSIVWAVLYVMMGLSLSFLMSRRPASWLLGLWGAQLALNFLWSLLFFMFRSPLWGLVDILLLDFLVVFYIVKVYATSVVSSWLFVPYALWLLLATYLNAYIFFHNS